MPGSVSPPVSTSLAELLDTRREDILERWRKRVEGHFTPGGLSRSELLDNLPELLRVIAAALRSQAEGGAAEYSSRVEAIARSHGAQRFRAGSDINEVVWEYGVLRDVLLELIEETGQPLPVPEWRVISHALTGGIAEAVGHFAEVRDQALRAREEELRSIIAARERLELERQRALDVLEHGDACFMLDRDWRFVLVNRNQERLSRKPREETLGKVFWELFPTLAQPGNPYWREYHRVMEERVVAEFEAYYPPLDLWTGVTTYPVREGGIAVFFRDVSERKRAEAARDFFLEASRVLSRSLELGTTLRSLAALVAEDLADYCLVDLLGENGQFHRQEAATRHEPLRPLLQRARAFPPLRGSSSPLDQVLEKGEPEIMQEITPQWLDSCSVSEEHRALLDEIDPKSTIIVPLVARGRKLGLINLVWTRRYQAPRARFLEVARGVAAQAAVAIDNARLYQEAQDAARVREEVMAIVSHDLRNPLGAISLSATGLLKREDLSPALAKGLSRIYAASDRAARLISQLLDFTQARAGSLPLHPRPADFHGLVRQVVEEVQLAHPERHICLETEGEARGAWDLDRVAQVITNLVGNAVQHSPSETPVRVSTRSQGDAVVLEVHNQGPPIPAGLLPLLFEPFRRGRAAEPQRGSVGLGLYISRQIVLGHGGRIDVRSTAEEGTTFIIRWPRGTPTEPASPLG